MSLDTVILYRRQTESTFDAGTLVHALRRVVALSEQPGRVRLPKVDLVWHLVGSEVGAVSPAPGDVIEDADAVRWTVNQPVRQETLGTRFRCPCVREVRT